MTTVKCVNCGQIKTVSCTPEQYKKWEQGQLIQQAMPNVPASERELLISHICGTCFDRLFSLCECESPDMDEVTTKCKKCGKQCEY